MDKWDSKLNDFKVNHFEKEWKLTVIVNDINTQPPMNFEFPNTFHDYSNSFLFSII